MNGTARHDQDELQFIPIILAVHTKAKSIGAIFKRLFLKAAIKNSGVTSRTQELTHVRAKHELDTWISKCLQLLAKQQKHKIKHNLP